MSEVARGRKHGNGSFARQVDEQVVHCVDDLVGPTFQPSMVRQPAIPMWIGCSQSHVALSNEVGAATLRTRAFSISGHVASGASAAFASSTVSTSAKADHGEDLLSSPRHSFGLRHRISFYLDVR